VHSLWLLILDTIAFCRQLKKPQIQELRLDCTLSNLKKDTMMSIFAIAYYRQLGYSMLDSDTAVGNLVTVF